MGAMILALACCMCVGDQPISPTEAAKLVGKKCTVEMTVRASKNAMEHRQVMFLDSETDFRDEKNFAIVISSAAVEKYKKQGIKDPSVHFKDKLIQVSGSVSVDEKKKPRIVVDDPMQIKIVDRRARLESRSSRFERMRTLGVFAI